MNSLLYRMYGIAVFIGILFALSGSARLCADVSPDTVPQLKMQIMTSTKFTLGEPIILHAEITNPSTEQRLWIQTGLYGTDWYTANLVDSNGVSVTAVPDTRTREPRGVFGPDFKIIGPSGTSSLDIVATRFMLIPHPGKYILKIHVHAAFAGTEAASENVSQVESRLKSAENVLVRDFIYQLTVTHADPAILQSRAETLEQNILTQTLGKSHDTDIDSLFSMPEGIAAPIWQQLADKGNLDTQARVVDHLANLHSSKAVDILFNIAQDKSGNSEFASEKLAEAYNEGNIGLREHIKSIAAQKGIQLPDKILVPVVID